jgi:[protein-PII] uridylyltransferase
MEEYTSRHASQGGSVFLLEPNIKEGLGGLWDLHTLMWIARAKAGLTSLGQLTEQDLASQSEQRELIRAHEFLLRARNALHFVTRFKQDKLSFDAQEEIAGRFGYEPTADHTAVDVFMRDYYSHAAIIARTSADILGRLTAPPEPTGLLSKLSSRKVRPGVTIAGGHLVAEESLFEEDSVELLRIFQDAQRQDLTLSEATQQIVRRNAKRLTLKAARSEEAVNAFMAILKSTDGVYKTLAEMNRLGVLGRLIPEFGRLFCMVQHDFYHVYTVDEHSLIGIRELEAVRAGEHAEDSPLLTQVMRECDRPELLFLAMMFHDLGKGYGGDHDERGALMVRDIGKRLHLHLDDRRSLEFLVRNHLMMSMLAQTRDIEDDELVAQFVRDVGTMQNLRNLYLLTFADMKAVGPAIWNGWRDHLLSELYLRAIDVLTTGAVNEVNRQARVRRVKNRLVAATAGEDERNRMESFLGQMPESYLLHTTDERIIDHWRLYESLGSGLFRAGVAHYPSRGFSELTVCTYDTEGLFVRLCGVLSARNLGIVSARIVTLAGRGIAIDTFRVDHANEDVDVLDPEVWAELRNDIEHVLADELDVAEMVDTAERSRPVPASIRRARKRARTAVEIDNVVSRKFSVIEMYAADRRGLLFRVANAIYDCGLTIHIAKINTHVNQVLDVFYVTDARGKKIRSEALKQRVVEAIRSQIIDEDGSPAVQPAESA